MELFLADGKPEPAQRCKFVAPATKIPWFGTPSFYSLRILERLAFYITVTRNIEWIEDNNNQECHKASLKATLWVHESFRRKLQFAVNLNNKGRLDGDIWGDGLCGFVWVFTLYLRNGATYEYEICTANSCDDDLKSEIFFKKSINYFWNYNQKTKKRTI